MNVAEAITSEIGYGFGSEVSVSGFLVISDAITYLAASETQQNQAVLLTAPWLVEAILNRDVPVSVGSMCLFGGLATIEGTLVGSDLGMVPLVFYAVARVTLLVDGRVVELLPPTLTS